MMMSIIPIRLAVVVLPPPHEAASEDSISLGVKELVAALAVVYLDKPGSGAEAVPWSLLPVVSRWV